MMANPEHWKDGKGWGISEDDEYAVVLYKRAIGELPEMESSKIIAKRMRELVSPNDHVLDAGCGAGHYLRSLRGAITHPFKYTGTDATALYLKYARKAYESQPNVDFVQGDIFELPFADKQFDVVMSNNVMMHLPSVEQPIRQLCRVAKKTVLIRMLGGDTTFRIQESRGKGDEVNPDGTLKSFAFLNIYSKDYLRHVIAGIPRVAKAEITEDWEYSSSNIEGSVESFKNHENPTNMIGKWQRVGYVLLPWVVIKLDLK